MCLYLYMAFSTLSNMIIEHHHQSEEKFQSLEKVRVDGPHLEDGFSRPLGDMKAVEGGFSDEHNMQDAVGFKKNKAHTESFSSREVAVGSRKLGPSFYRGQSGSKSSSERPLYESSDSQTHDFEKEGKASVLTYVDESSEFQADANENSLYDNSNQWKDRELEDREFSMSLTVLYSDNRENLRKGPSFCDQLVINAETPNVITGKDVISAIQRDNPGLDTSICTFRYSMTQVSDCEPKISLASRVCC